jgi:hypothetical protein
VVFHGQDRGATLFGSTWAYEKAAYPPSVRHPLVECLLSLHCHLTLLAGGLGRFSGIGHICQRNFLTESRSSGFKLQA